MTAIDDKRNELPWLGNPVDEGDGRGCSRDYENGSIFWTPQTGAHEVHGAIRVKWAQLGGTRGFLGYPITDETGTPDGRGRFNHFDHGSIYWAPQTGAHEVHGAIRDLWASMGWERSKLGYPVSDEMDMPGGRLSRFAGGENLFPAEIEQFLIRHPKVADVQVVGVPDAFFGEELLAVVIPKVGEPPSEQELRDYCRGQICHQKTPRYFQFVDAYPITASGKVQKFVLREQAISMLGLQEVAHTKTT